MKQLLAAMYYEAVFASWLTEWFGPTAYKLHGHTPHALRHKRGDFMKAYKQQLMKNVGL